MKSSVSKTIETDIVNILDPDLREAHATTPFINIWDDHEITNNAYIDGAQNHQENEGSYTVRKNIAKQVFYEWLPIRESEKHYRHFDFGTTVDLFMLDERLAGRTVQADSITDPRRFDPEHKLLGDEQMAWLIEGLQNSDATWKVIGNQVIFSYSDWGYEGFSQNMDAWDGYPNDQNELTNAITANQVDNLVFVTGDTHTAWAFEAASEPFDKYNSDTSDGAIGVEFGVTSISSGNSNERNEDEVVIEHENKILKKAVNPHLKYVNMRDHGYLILDIMKDQLKANFKIVSTLKERNQTVTTDKQFIVKSGSTKLHHAK